MQLKERTGHGADPDPAPGHGGVREVGVAIPLWQERDVALRLRPVVNAPPIALPGRDGVLLALLGTGPDAAHRLRVTYLLRRDASLEVSLAVTIPLARLRLRRPCLLGRHGQARHVHRDRQHPRRRGRGGRRERRGNRPRAAQRHLLTMHSATLDRLRKARAKVALLVVADPVYAPVFARLEAEVADADAALSGNAVARARAVLRQSAMA
jgi:hypothetical protein